MVSQELVKKLKKILEKGYGTKLTDKEAQEAANNLVAFFELLIKFDSKNQKNKL